ncbi:MAG: hypothetical protein JNJ54_37360 [Myxococcaceae bacterium]|nr:hypothetical protein [Myxococcaceae bacterium]
MLTLLASLVVTQTAPDLKAIAAENRASYEAALAALLKRQKLTRVELELAFDAQVTKPGMKNVKLGAWHEPDRDDLVPREPALATDTKGVLHLVWGQAESKKTVVVEVEPKPAPPAGMPPPMRELRGLVPEAVTIEKLGPDVVVTFKATTVEYRAKKKP